MEEHQHHIYQNSDRPKIHLLFITL